MPAFISSNICGSADKRWYFLLLTNYIVTVSRNGKLYQQKYSQGKALADVQEIGTSTSTGTEVFFQPDGSIFQELVYNYDTLAARLRELAFLNKGITITLTDERRSIS